MKKMCLDTSLHSVSIRTTKKEITLISKFSTNLVLIKYTIVYTVFILYPSVYTLYMHFRMFMIFNNKNIHKSSIIK